MTDSLSSFSFTDMLDRARDMGFSALETATGNWSKAPHLSLDALLDNSAAQKKFTDAITVRSLKIDALNCSGNQLAPNESGKAHQSTVEKTFKLAGQLGVKKVVMMSGLPGGCAGDKTPNWIISSWPPENEKILEWQWNERIIPYWEKTVNLAGQCGIKKIALENHGSQAVYNVESLLRLRKAVGSVVGMNLDPGHLFWMGGDGCAAVRALGSALYHIHAKDVRIEYPHAAVNGLLETLPADKAGLRSWNYTAVGFGHDLLWWKTFFASARMAGYDGAVSLEMEDVSMSQTAGCVKSLEVLRSALELQTP
jgi:sugar phosphate isomerase/epimerase